MLFHKPEATNCATCVRCRLRFVIRNEKNLSAGKNSWTATFAEFGKVSIPFTGSFFYEHRHQFRIYVGKGIEKNSSFAMLV